MERKLAALQLWTQIVGKVRLALTPAINHTWNVPLYPTVRGLTTSPMPHGNRFLQIDFDFIGHVLVLQTSDDRRATVDLRPTTVANFYQEVMVALDRLETPVRIWQMPVEIAQAVPFDQDLTYRDTTLNTCSDSGASCCNPLGSSTCSALALLAR
jgi:hypothetical protein